MPLGNEKVTIQLKDTPTKVYAIGAKLFLSKVPLEVLQNLALIQLIVTPHILWKVQGQIKEVCGLIEPCLLISTREYNLDFSRPVVILDFFLDKKLKWVEWQILEPVTLLKNRNIWTKYTNGFLAV